jgi:ribosome maturation protein Sdo1
MDLKHLKDLLKVLRDKGVTEFKTEGIEIKLSEEVPQSKYKRKQDEGDIEEDELSEEDLIYYSATAPIENTEAQ